MGEEPDMSEVGHQLNGGNPVQQSLEQRGPEVRADGAGASAFGGGSSNGPGVEGQEGGHRSYWEGDINTPDGGELVEVYLGNGESYVGRVDWFRGFAGSRKGRLKLESFDRPRKVVPEEEADEPGNIVEVIYEPDAVPYGGGSSTVESSAECEDPMTGYPV
jgi:hypothetical protein